MLPSALLLTLLLKLLKLLSRSEGPGSMAPPLAASGHMSSGESDRPRGPPAAEVEAATEGGWE